MNTSARWPTGRLLSSLANACRTGEVHYLIVFEAGRGARRAGYRHGFATFVRASGEGPHPESYGLETLTVSWLPRSLEVAPAAPLPEPGVNLDLPATLRHVLSGGGEVSRWGPFAVEPFLYERAARQIRRLTSGIVRFKAADAGFPAARVSNGAHAVGDVALETPHVRPSPPPAGEAAGARLARCFRPWLLEPPEVHEWRAARLGLEDCPITARPLELPPGRRRRSFPAA